MSVSGLPDITGETRRPHFDVLRAVPPGSRRARDQREWLRAALAEIDAAEFRSNRRDHYEGVARVLTRYMDWRARTTRPGHDRIAAAIDASADTVGRAVRWLADRGLLGLVAAGTTPMVRPFVLHGAEGNTAAVYVLTIPRKTRQRPRADAGQNDIADLSGPRRGPGKAPRAREDAGKVKSPAKGGQEPAPRAGLVLPRGGRAVPGAGAAAPGRRGAVLGAVPQNRSEGLSAAAAMQERVRLLERISARNLRHLARPFWAAGWTPRDVLHALDYGPGGRQHRYSATVRHVPGWIRARLAEWTGPGAAPLPSRSQQLEAERARRRADQAGQRAAAAAIADQAGGPAAAAAGGALARQLLRSRPRPQTPPAAAAAAGDAPPNQEGNQCPVSPSTPSTPTRSSTSSGARPSGGPTSSPSATTTGPARPGPRPSSPSSSTWASPLPGSTSSATPPANARSSTSKPTTS